MTRTPALILLAACTYEPPIDPNAPDLLNRVGGEVVFGGGPDVATTFVTVYAADDLPPPVGLGRPLTFAAVSEKAFTGGDATLRSAPFSVTQLPDGDYALGALTDVDGDFQPLAPFAMGGATCGDWGGAHLASLADSDFGTISLKGGQSVDDVTILVGSQYTIERPAFRFASADPIPLADLVGPLPKTFRLQATSVDTVFTNDQVDHPTEDLELHLGPACAPAPIPYCDQLPFCACDTTALAECATAQWVYLMDKDADGVPDPYPAEAQAAAGLLDVWPRVYLESAAELETWVDADGVERQERWVAEAYPLLLEILGTVLAGGTPMDVVPLGIPVPVEQLSVTLSTTFVHYHEGGQLVDPVDGPFDYVDLALMPDAMGEVPDGAWAVTVVSFTGQTWTVPNEVGLLGLESLDPAFDPATQAGALVFVR